MKELEAVKSASAAVGMRKREIVVYNTLSRKKEKLNTIDTNLVRMYSCGPTVYNYAHIGNLRTYVFMDILRRVLKYEGFELKHVMNITDVGHLVSDEDEGEDKMLKGAREQKKTPWEIAEYFTEAFLKDIAKLNIEVPEIIPKATEHIDIMIDFVKGLMDKGYGYETSDGIYFDIGKFDGYGKLSRLDLDEQIAGARVNVNVEKRHPADFALWKKAPKEHIMQWESPWGMGYPGWHIECSAMSMKYLGETFDIHTGGVDHIPVHHENEIAQSEALLGKPAVNYWLHGEFMMVDNGKMSKSLGNTYLMEDIEKRGIPPLAFRYFCLNAHYRNKLNFTWDAMKSASVSYRRFIEGALAHRSAGNADSAGRSADGAERSADGAERSAEGAELADGAEFVEGVEFVDGAESPKSSADNVADADTKEAGAEVRAATAKFSDEFEMAVIDDLNIPKALGIAWNVIRYPIKSPVFYKLLLDMDRIFGLGVKEAGDSLKGTTGIREVHGMSVTPTVAGISGITTSLELPADVIALLNERDEARAAKDFKKSDEIRDKLKAMGYEVRDTKDGVVVKQI
ncbi:MAG: cysteine--tRNA ligase [Oscillospiraceae bacterium]|nr:cysteine--tRNA ligase [Oscillospiraceae bacterium]